MCGSVSNLAKTKSINLKISKYSTKNKLHKKEKKVFHNNINIIQRKEFKYTV